MPEGRAGARSKPQAKCIDGAEHSAMLNRVMAVDPSPSSIATDVNVRTSRTAPSPCALPVVRQLSETKRIAEDNLRRC